jgi:integrase
MPTPRRRSFGTIDKRSSGRYRARYQHAGQTWSAPETFLDRRAAERWLADVDRSIGNGTWTPPTKTEPEPAQSTVLSDYAERWLRERKLKLRTRDLYRGLLDRNILPTLGKLDVAAITLPVVRTWHANLTIGDTARAHSYALLRTILNSALDDELIDRNPCRIRGAGRATRTKDPVPFTPTEYAKLRLAIEPESYKVLLDVAVFAGLRFGELVGLKWGDVDLAAGKLLVRRGIVSTKGRREEQTTKSGRERAVFLPPVVVEVLRKHRPAFAPAERYVFGGGASPLAYTTLRMAFKAAAVAAGRPDASLHLLRHTALTWTAGTGASLAETMRRGGHSTVQAAMGYQHGSDDRDRRIAELLDEIATATRSEDDAA